MKPHTLRAAAGCASLILLAGWNWDSAHDAPGDSLTWRVCAGQFSTAEEDEITFAANGWDAGPGEHMRGAHWNFIRGADLASGECGPDDNDDELYMRTDTWFANHGLQGAWAACLKCDGGENDYDIVFNRSISWTTTVPSTSDVSIGQVALHEFGHIVGFNHEDQYIATMNSQYPNGGDISVYKYRPHENDYAGLVANRPDSSTGKNLMLGRFVEQPGDPGDSIEVWNNNSLSGWTVCDDTVADPGGPEEIYAIIHGTSSASPWIEWWVSADTTCNWASPDYLVGSRQPTMGSNTPYLVHPNPYDFRGVPAGNYYLCAYIDPDDLITETHAGDADNTLRSQVTMTVQDCP